MDEWGYSERMDSKGDRKRCRIYQEMFCFFNGMGMCFLPCSRWISHHGWCYEKYFLNDIPDHNLQDSVEDTFEDAMIPFIFQHDIAPVHIARNFQIWLDEHDVQVIQ